MIQKRNPQVMQLSAAPIHATPKPATPKPATTETVTATAEVEIDRTNV
jgi:hypothetical protein